MAFTLPSTSLTPALSSFTRRSHPISTERLSLRSFTPLKSSSHDFTLKPTRLVTCKAVIKEGDVAPAVTLKNQNGKSVSLKQFRGKNVIFYFFPKADTPGCTKQACAFRDSYTIFKKNGAEVIGVSGDSPEALKGFAEQYNLPFTLLSDEGNAIREEWGVPSDLFGLLPGRQTYVIDKKGVVQLVFNNQFQPEKHIDRTLEILTSS